MIVCPAALLYFHPYLYFLSQEEVAAHKRSRYQIMKEKAKAAAAANQAATNKQAAAANKQAAAAAYQREVVGKRRSC